MLQTTNNHHLNIINIPKIQYQNTLTIIPTHITQKLKNQINKLTTLNNIITIQPQSNFKIHINQNQQNPTLHKLPTITNTTNKPYITTLLNNFPITTHTTLNNQLHIHPINIQTTQTPINLHNHNTTITSLILHNNLHHKKQPINQKITIIPILTNNTTSNFKSTPQNKLPIKIIYHTLKTIITTNPTTQPHLTNITIINHSINNTISPFIHHPST